MAGVHRERLRELVNASGKSARSVSRAAGLGETAIKDILSGRSFDPGAATLSKIADQLGITVDMIMDPDRVPSPTRRVRPSQLRLPIRHEVAGGAFMRRDEAPQVPFGYATVPTIPPYDEFPQWAERLVGDSMDRLIPDGSILHVVDAVAIEYVPRTGDIVIVERISGQGSLVERSAKQVRVTTTGIELVPRSNNPNFKTAIRIAYKDGDPEDLEVLIVGLVLRAHQDLVGVPDDPDIA